MAKVFRILLPVSDIEQAAVFYGAVLDQPGQRISPGRHYFDCEGLVLACFDPMADGDGYDAKPIPEPIYVAVDDLEAVYARVGKAGGVFSNDEMAGAGALGRIEKRPWGEMSFYVSDPFGNPLCFVTRNSVFTGDA